MAILHIKVPSMPDFRFEWHPDSKMVYSIRLSHQPLVGEILAFNIADHGSAINAVNIWLRGHHAGRSDVPVAHLVA